MLDQRPEIKLCDGGSYAPSTRVCISLAPARRTMEFNMHKLRQTMIELLGVADKTSSHIQEML